MSTATPALPGAKFLPSPRQQDVFDSFFALVAGGTLQINAVAGSGKSTTLEQLLALMDEAMRNKTLLCAFGRDIRDALKERVQRRGWKCEVKTIHQIGYGACSKHFRKVYGLKQWEPECNGTTKYRRLIAIWFINRGRDPIAEPGEAEEAMADLVNMCRVTLTDYKDAEAVKAMAIERELIMPDPELMCEALVQILEWGINGLPQPDEKGFTYSPKEWIDFTDQLWLPHVLNLTPWQHENVLVDECQDLSAAQLEICMKARKPAGKMVFVGDPAQAIFAFAGAKSDSFDYITKITNAVLKPLDVCYRCGREIVALANILVPAIQPSPTAPEGLVQVVRGEFFFDNVTEKDMVLCRTTAPLIETFFKLIKLGKRAKVKGRDFSEQLIKICKAVEKLDKFDFKKFGEFLTIWENNQLRALENKDNADALRQSIMDKAACILAIYEGVLADRPASMKSVEDLQGQIDAMFSDKSEYGVILLCTIHRAKGLEADTVFFMHPELCPHPMAKTADAMKQETNLKYVAYTRAKKALYVVDTVGKYTAKAA